MAGLPSGCEVPASVGPGLNGCRETMRPESALWNMPGRACRPASHGNEFEFALVPGSRIGMLLHGVSDSLGWVVAGGAGRRGRVRHKAAGGVSVMARRHGFGGRGPGQDGSGVIFCPQRSKYGFSGL